MVQIIEAQPVDPAFAEEKVFCIGLLKTGTTSLEQALKDLGYRLGDQHQGELLLEAYVARDFKKIVEFCLTADAFQDVPFCFPFTFAALDQSFPNAKFILSVRGDSEQWYRSLVRFHGNSFAGGRIPVKDDLLRADYCYPGFIWDVFHHVWNVPDDDPYHKPLLVSFYDKHNSDVRDYFRHKSNLLEVNLSEKGAYEKLCRFLNKQKAAEDFPRLNASSPLTNDNLAGASPINLRGTPKMSVLVVTYNQEKHIRQALDSVIMQKTNFEIEVIIADDNSQDATSAIAREYAAAHKNVCVLPTNQHLGISGNYQRGFAACRGDYIAIIEGDDYWISPDKLESVVAFLDEHPECVFCFHRAIKHNEVNDQLSIHPPLDANKDFGFFTARELARENFIPGLSTCTYRRDLIAAQDQGLWQLKFREWPFNIVVAQAGLIGYLAEVMSIYRAHPGGIWSLKPVNEWQTQLSELLPSYDKYLNFKFNTEFEDFKRRVGGPVAGNKVKLPVSLRRQRLRAKLALFIPPVLLPLATKVSRKIRRVN